MDKIRNEHIRGKHGSDILEARQRRESRYIGKSNVKIELPGRRQRGDSWR